MKKRAHKKRKKSAFNVTLGGLLTFFCFLCGQELEIRTDKNKKFYFICNPCGFQGFVRGAQGMKNLLHLIEVLRQYDFAIREHSEMLHRIQSVLAEIKGLENETENLDSTFDFFAGGRRIRDKTRIRKSLDARIDALLAELERIAHSDAKSA